MTSEAARTHQKPQPVVAKQTTTYKFWTVTLTFPAMVVHTVLGGLCLGLGFKGLKDSIPNALAHPDGFLAASAPLLSDLAILVFGFAAAIGFAGMLSWIMGAAWFKGLMSMRPRLVYWMLVISAVFHLVLLSLGPVLQPGASWIDTPRIFLAVTVLTNVVAAYMTRLYLREVDLFNR